MADAERSAGILSELKALGVGLDIDDSGTGYSSLSRLQGFRVDTLKIDRVFVSRMDTDAETHEIVRVIVMLAHHLGMKVVAEGVETQAQMDMLRDLGCERAQGYLFSRPVDHEAILKLLTTNRAGVVSLPKYRQDCRKVGTPKRAPADRELEATVLLAWQPNTVKLQPLAGGPDLGAAGLKADVLRSIPANFSAPAVCDKVWHPCN